MASLEAKILGERAENYCSSDEGDHAEDRDDPCGPVQNPESSSSLPFPAAAGAAPPPGCQGGPPLPPNSTSKFGGSQNTGPKGVLRDWELYKEHQELLRLQQDQDLIRMVKESSLTCRTDSEDQQAQQMLEEIQDQISQDPESEDLEDLLSDKVLEQFIQKRMQLMSNTRSVEFPPKFGSGLVELPSGDVFLQVVDTSDPRVPVLVHIYDDQHPECSTMNECLSSLSELYPRVQFCKMRAQAAGVSVAFKAKGIPALLVYKGGALIGNFVQMKEEFGSEFYVGDVENFLIENGMIEDRTNVPTLLAEARKVCKNTN